MNSGSYSEISSSCNCPISTLTAGDYACKWLLNHCSVDIGTPVNSICCNCSLMLPNAFHGGFEEDHKWQRLLVHIVYSLPQLIVEPRSGTLMQLL